MRIIVLIALVLLLAGCKSNRTQCDYSFSSDNRVVGQLNGLNLNFLDGIESVERHGVLSYFKIDLFEREIADSNCIGRFNDSLTRLNIHVPYKVGLYETAKGDDLAIKVMRLDSNYFSDCAAVEIISKTDTSIEGSLFAYFEGGGQLNGRFKVKICR